MELSGLSTNFWHGLTVLSPAQSKLPAGLGQNGMGKSRVSPCPTGERIKRRGEVPSSSQLVPPRRSTAPLPRKRCFTGKPSFRGAGVKRDPANAFGQRPVVRSTRESAAETAGFSRSVASRPQRDGRRCCIGETCSSIHKPCRPNRFLSGRKPDLLTGASRGPRRAN